MVVLIIIIIIITIRFTRVQMGEINTARSCAGYGFGRYYSIQKLHSVISFKYNTARVLR